MKVNRRNFFKLLAGAGAVAVLAPKLLVSPRKTWVDIKFTTHDLMLSLDDFEARVMEPAMRKMAERLDGLALQELAKGKPLKLGYDINNEAYPKTVSIIQHYKPIEFGSNKFG